jgi:proteasome maturation protein
MPQSNIHLDILMGRDEILDTSDFMGGKLYLIKFVD